MRLDAGAFRYLTKEDIRILTSVEMGLKNHEYVPEQLIESIAHLRRCGVFGRIQVLMKHGLLCHQGGKGDGYKLTYNGYDCLALRALTNRGVIDSIGTRIGVGKESDIHMCTDSAGSPLVVKFHRLGRISFRTVKLNRDYLEGRSHASWMYMARLAAKKEFQYMQALYEAGFPVPKPIENSRHAVLMEYMADSIPLYQIHPSQMPESAVPVLLNQIFKLLVRFAACGLIHGDFNEFNLLVDLGEVRKVTVIDFPQIISIQHPEAQHQFERDVNCVCRFFGKRFRFEVEDPPTFVEAFAEFEKNLNNDLRLKLDGDEELIQVLAEVESDVEGDEEGDDEGDEEGIEKCATISESDSTPGANDSDNSSDNDFIDTPRRVIEDPRHVLRMKLKKERELAPKMAPSAPKVTRAKPNRQKRGQHSHAAREVRAWKAEGGW